MSEINNTENKLHAYIEAHSLATGIPMNTLLHDTNFLAMCKCIIEQLSTT